MMMRFSSLLQYILGVTSPSVTFKLSSFYISLEYCNFGRIGLLCLPTKLLLQLPLLPLMALVPSLITYAIKVKTISNGMDEVTISKVVTTIMVAEMFMVMCNNGGRNGQHQGQ